MSEHFGETLRKSPADADTPGYELLVRAGYIRSLAPGLFSYLPLGLRSLRKIEEILREELDGIDAQEIGMPIVQPAALWAESGRLDQVAEETVRFRDRADRSWVIGPSHEEVAAQLVRSSVKSYRQLPVVLYQIQPTYRDEARPRGGLLRAREFTLLASYSFDRDLAGLEISHSRHREAFLRGLARVGLPNVRVAEGDASSDEELREELILPTPTGDDGVALCTGCGYAANQRVARFGKPEPAREVPAALEMVETPGAASIASLAEYLGVPAQRTAKVVFFQAAVPESEASSLATRGSGEHDVVVMALVRGDMEVSEAKLRAASSARALRPAEAAVIRAVGAEPGYASPIGLTGEALFVVVDDLVARSPNLISGANEHGFHYRNVNAGRDYRPDMVADIAAVVPGAPCAKCGSPLTVELCLELGSLRRFKAAYTAKLGATYQDEDGSVRALAMGSYGIGLGRVLGCLAETHRDEKGLRLPPSVAPFDLYFAALGGGDLGLTARADDLYSSLRDAGIDVLYDDRDASPGVKFNDADLIGIPLRATLGSRSLEAGGLELKRREATEKQIVPLHDAVETIARLTRW